MKIDSNKKTILLIWLFWGVLMIGYQTYIRARLDLKRPDYAVFWTPSETQADSQDDKPYLLEPFLNQHVSWDSEYYLSIAIGGYDDPQMRAIPENYSWNSPRVALKGERPEWVSMNYAFFPFYPFMIRLFSYPLSLFGMNPTATATLAIVAAARPGRLAHCRRSNFDCLMRPPRQQRYRMR